MKSSNPSPPSAPNILQMGLCFVLCAAIGVTAGCIPKKEWVFTGKTMGTTYSVKVVAGYFQDQDDLAKAIEQRLEDVNQSMSIFRKDSEISRFNRHAASEPFPVSKDFAEVMTVGKRLHAQSNGAWDATVGPLVELWGFGTREQTNRVPDPEAIRNARAAVGFHHIEIVNGSTLIKHNPDVNLDMGSIAKGFGVDVVARMIASKGFHDYLVEIGGEVAAAGTRPDGNPWRIGINTPVPGSPFDQVYKVVTLRDRAMATSGDYRNFFVMDGVLYSHVIDPRTAYPVANGVVSVSVIADNCTYADGLATAIMVMGESEGMELIRKLPEVDGMIVTRNQKGELENHFSDNFQSYVR